LRGIDSRGAEASRDGSSRSAGAVLVTGDQQSGGTHVVGVLTVVVIHMACCREPLDHLRADQDFSPSQSGRRGRGFPPRSPARYSPASPVPLPAVFVMQVCTPWRCPPIDRADHVYRHAFALPQDAIERRSARVCGPPASALSVQLHQRAQIGESQRTPQSCSCIGVRPPSCPLGLCCARTYQDYSAEDVAPVLCDGCVLRRLWRANRVLTGVLAVVGPLWRRARICAASSVSSLG